MRSNDFDRIAFAYDRMVKLVFGNAIIDSQKFFLHRIPDDSNILILGGGTGRILTELFKIKENVSVCYIDASENMLRRAREKAKGQQIQFILGTENDIPSDNKFDCVLTNFYFDLFTKESLLVAIDKIKKSIVPKAQWIATDFVETRWWQTIMLKSMYFFFRLMSNVETQKLPEWNKALQAIGGKEVGSQKFYRGFIQTSVFQF